MKQKSWSGFEPLLDNFYAFFPPLFFKILNLYTVKIGHNTAKMKIKIRVSWTWPTLYEFLLVSFPNFVQQSLRFGCTSNSSEDTFYDASWANNHHSKDKKNSSPEVWKNLLLSPQNSCVEVPSKFLFSLGAYFSRKRGSLNWKQ